MGGFGWEDSDDRDASPADAGQDEGEDGSASDAEADVIIVHYLDGTKDEFRAATAGDYNDDTLEITEEDTTTLIPMRQMKKAIIKARE